MKRSRISYLILLFLSFVYIYFDGGFLPYTVFYTVLMLPVVSAVYLVIVYNTFKYVEKLEKQEYQKGEILEYTLRIYNNTPLYVVYFTVYMHMEGRMLIKNMKNERIALKPFSVQEFKFRVPVMYRGRYKVGISHIEIRDFLNLVSVKYFPDETKQIRVFPRILPVTEPDLPCIRMSENEYMSRNRDAGNTEISDIRDYIYGDSFKKIHWKLSSKFNKWLVKETTSSSEREIRIILNLSKIDGEAEEVLKTEDRTVEFLISEAKALLNAGFSVKLCFYRSGRACLEYSGENGFMQLYELLSFIPFDQQACFEDVVNMFTESMPERQNIMIFSPVIDEKQIDCYHKMAANGHSVSLFYCKAAESEIKKEIESAIENELPELGIKTVNLFKIRLTSDGFTQCEREGAGQ